MATEVITRTLCDVHLADNDESLDGAAYTISIDGETWELDVCPVDAKVIAEFRQWVGKYGRTPDRPRKRNDPRPGTPTGTAICPAPDCGHAFDTTRKLTAHVRNAHDTTLANLEGRTTNFPCPRCGQYFEGRQGLSVHVSRRHSGDWSDPALASEPEPEAAPRRKGRKSA